MPVIASVIILALIASTIFHALNVAVGGGSVILAWRLQSRLDISAASSSLSSLCADGSDTVSAMRRPVQGFSGWSRPMLPDHADLAATEQAQREAARARRGGRLIRRALSAHFDPRTHRCRGSPAFNHCQLPSWASYLLCDASRDEIKTIADTQRPILIYYLLPKNSSRNFKTCVRAHNSPSKSSHPRGPLIPPAWKSHRRSACHPVILTPASPTPQQRPKEQLHATPAIGPLSSTQLDYSDAAVTATLVLAGPLNRPTT